MPVEVVGVFAHANGPIAKQLVMVEPGMNAVYGVNGSGKTFFLESIAAYAAGGQWMRGGLVLRLKEPTDEELWTVTGEAGPGTRRRRFRSIFGVWSNASSEYYESPELWRNSIRRSLLDCDEDDPVVASPFRGFATGEWAPNDWSYTAVPDSPHNRALIDEVLDYGYLLALPRPDAMGHTGGASWSLWPFCFPSEQTPALNDEIARFGAAGHELDRHMAWYIADRGDILDDDPRVAEDDRIEEQYHRAIDFFGNAELGASLLTNSFLPVPGPGELDALAAGWPGPVFLRSVGSMRTQPWTLLRDNLIPRATAHHVEETSVIELTRLVLTTLGAPNSGDGFTESVLALAERLSGTATAVVGELLIDPFTLHLDVGDAKDLVRGTHPRWRAIVDDRGWKPREGLALSELSRAQRRWAEFAIRLALQAESRAQDEATGESWLWLMDEPESALHRSAEEYLARGLVSLAQRHGAIVVAATHSPELLDDPRTRVLRAHPGPEGTTIQPYGHVEKQALVELGLRPSDMLRRQRVFLLVEGAHEEAILDALFRDDLRSMRAQVLPARGASKFAAVFDSQLLFRYTDATVLVVIDNQSAQTIQSLWSEARAAAQVGDVARATEQIRSALPKAGSAENIFLQQFLTRAIEEGEHERVEVFGFSKRDITDYLPIEVFAPFDSWDAARMQHAASGSKDAFKRWLENAYGSDFSGIHLRAVTASLEAAPDEFLALLTQLAAITNS